MLLVHAAYTDLRWRRIRNPAVAAAAGAGLLLGAATHGLPGLERAAQGLLAGAVWWPAVRFLRLGAGDAKLAMAIGALLGPAAAVLAPAVGYALCGVGTAVWIAWRRRRRLPWRGVALPLAPWIAAGTVLTVAGRASGRW